MLFMTIGNKFEDLRSIVQLGDWYFPVTGVPVFVPSGPPQAVGWTFSKTWNGGDYPTTPVAKVPRLVYSRQKETVALPKWWEKRKRIDVVWPVGTTNEQKQAHYANLRLQRKRERAKKKAEAFAARLLRWQQRQAAHESRKQKYLVSWQKRREKPRRLTTVSHPYSCIIEKWRSTAWSYTNSSLIHPIRVESLSIRSSRLSFGTGFTLRPGQEPSWSNNDTIALQGKLREKIVGSDFDMSVFLGEGRMALKMIGDTAVTLAKALLLLKAGRMRDAASKLGIKRHTYTNKQVRLNNPELVDRDMASRWLELQYGWLPLLKDVEGGAQALAQQLNNPAVQRYRVRRRRVLSMQASTGVSGFAWSALYGQLDAHLTEVNTVALNGLLDPSSVAWELLPWSFVADWFIPIGSYLSARGMAQAVSGTFVTTITTRDIATIESYMQKTAGWAIAVGPTQEYVRVTVNRTVSTTLSTPKPQFKPLESVLTWKRAANSIALLLLAAHRQASKIPAKDRFTETE